MRAAGPPRHPAAGGTSDRRLVPTGRVARAAAVTAAAAVLALGPTSIGPAAAQDGPGDQDAGEPRVRDLVYRVRDLEYRWRALDNSERVEQSAEQTTVTFAADVLFEYDRADLTPAAQSRLEDVARDLSDLGPRTVTVDGHTDDHGDPAYNQDLSVRRAQAVQAALDSHLGDGFDFAVAGHGETRPVAPNEHAGGADNPEGRALNRRVEISYPTE